VPSALTQQGAEAIVPGGTDLAPALDEKSAGFPLVDCAGIHVDAIVRDATLIASGYSPANR
jgi:aspartate racemase